ncbi:MKI67 FHA domain-interacting nucleolar phosphoprotein-like [Dermacentor silvarum]|uniref:MKI67 FHA domain-interacting nucleolar phosphoprotein-like n=1 Tax=Dermacentor silvarum TaxID=543639 RepID=UPI0018972831|nr:MKI67 FHA domain-interacting nucleolar phosphoprotein-like [Dermacentor silvarum]
MAKKKVISKKKEHGKPGQEQQKEQRRGVIYIKHIPHGFYEEEMKKYFSQFGTVTNLRLSRSGKTGGSRGYAFIEFLSEDVAKIVADTMDGYLFFNKIMKCSVVPREHVHEGLFRHFRYPFPLRKEVVRTVHNRRRTTESEKRSAHRRLATLERTRAQLRKMGVRCDFVPEVPTELLEPLDSKDTSKASVATDSGLPSFVVDSSDDSITFKTPPGTRKKRKVKPGKPATTLVDVTPSKQATSPKKSAKLLTSPGSKTRRRGPIVSTPHAVSPKAGLTKASTPKTTPVSKRKRKATPAKT